MCPTCCASTARPRASVRSEPLLRELLRRAFEPRLFYAVAQLCLAELLQIADADEHGGVAVPVRRREVDAARLDEHVLDLEVIDPEHEHVVEPLARLGIEGVRPPAAVEA